MRKLLYLIARVFFYGFSSFSIFVALFSILSILEYYMGLNMPLVEILTKENVQYVSISIPFMELYVQYVFGLNIVLVWLSLVFYSIYFFSLRGFFKVFVEEKMFTQSSLNKLSLFYRLNAIAVLFLLVRVIVFMVKEQMFYVDETFFILLLHVFVTILVFFYMDMMKKGSLLQQENDLTI